MDELIGLILIGLLFSSLMIPFIASHLYIGYKSQQKQSGKIIASLSMLLLLIYMGSIGFATYMGIMFMIMSLFPSDI
jgi:hypothetical protein